MEKAVHYYFEISDSSEGQGRWLKINGQEYQFSDKDNLSYEDLHLKVYEEFVDGKGVRSAEVIPVTELIEKLRA